MKTTPRLQSIITQIAQKHEMDLDKPGAYLRLEVSGDGYLVIENIGAGRVSVTNFVEVGNDFMMDPQVVFYTEYVAESELAEQTNAPATHSWVPLERTEVMGGWTLYAELDAQGNLTLHDPEGQEYLAEITERVLAPNLVRFGWLGIARRATSGVKPWHLEEIYARDIRTDVFLDSIPDPNKEGAEDDDSS